MGRTRGGGGGGWFATRGGCLWGGGGGCWPASVSCSRDTAGHRRRALLRMHRLHLFLTCAGERRRGASRGHALRDFVLPAPPRRSPRYLPRPTTLEAADSAVTVAPPLYHELGYSWDETPAPTITRDRRRQPRASICSSSPHSRLSPGADIHLTLARRCTRWSSRWSVHAATPRPRYAAGHLFEPLGLHTSLFEPLDASGTVNCGSGNRAAARDLLKFVSCSCKRGWSGLREQWCRGWVELGPPLPQVSAVGRRSASLQSIHLRHARWVDPTPTPPAFLFAWGLRRPVLVCRSRAK